MLNRREGVWRVEPPPTLQLQGMTVGWRALPFKEAEGWRSSGEMRDGGGFKKFTAINCKMLLGLAANRMKIHRNKKHERKKALEREVAEFMVKGNHLCARSRTISLIHEENLLQVMDQVEIHIETLKPSLRKLELAASCPDELVLPLGSIIIAGTSPRAGQGGRVWGAPPLSALLLCLRADPCK